MGNRTDRRVPQVIGKAAQLILLIAYCGFWGFVCLGWIVTKPTAPWFAIPGHRGMFFVLLGLLAAFIPFILMKWKQRVGARAFVLSALPAAITVVAMYLFVSTYYYYHAHHPFDPFLQMPPQRFKTQLDKDPKHLRILFLGGSTTFDPLCTSCIFPHCASCNYPDYLRQLLQSRYPSVQLEILNGAMPWYTSKHSLINYVTYCRNWHPDLVVILHAINDTYRSFSPPQYAIGNYDDLYAHFYGPSIKGANPPTFETNLAWRLKLFPNWYPGFRYREFDFPLERYVSIHSFETNMRTLVHYARADGAAVILVTQPYLYKERMSTKERATLWMGKEYFVTKTGVLTQQYASAVSIARAMNAFNDVTAKIAQSEGVMLADAEPHIAKDLNYFRDDVHYTPAGAEAVARIVAGAIIQSGIEDRLAGNKKLP